jgi:putative membrane protein
LTLICPLVFSLAGLYGCHHHNAVQAASEEPVDRNVLEREFMISASQAHAAEIDIANAAKTRSRNQEVKRFAGVILKEHTAALQNLTTLMNKKNVPPVASPTPEMRDDIARLSTLSGPEFDREFVNMMVSGHEQTLELFRETSAAAHDTDVQDFVDAMIPKMDKQLMEAQELQSKLFSAPAPTTP